MSLCFLARLAIAFGALLLLAPLGPLESAISHEWRNEEGRCTEHLTPVPKVANAFLIDKILILVYDGRARDKI